MNIKEPIQKEGTGAHPDDLSAALALLLADAAQQAAQQLQWDRVERFARSLLRVALDARKELRS